MSKFTRYILIALSILALAAIRFFEEYLFYDPYLQFFKNDYLYMYLPILDTWRLVVNMLFRYTLNSLVTLGIIWVLFERKDYLKFSGFFLMLAFMLLIIVFLSNCSLIPEKPLA